MASSLLVNPRLSFRRVSTRISGQNSVQTREVQRWWWRTRGRRTVNCRQVSSGFTDLQLGTLGGGRVRRGGTPDSVERRTLSPVATSARARSRGPAGAEISVEFVRPGNSIRPTTRTFARPPPGVRVDEWLLHRPDRVATPTDCGPCCARSNGGALLQRPTHGRRFREPVAHLGGVNVPALVP